MRLLIIGNVFAPFSSGGSAVIAKLQVDWFQKHKINTRVITLNNCFKSTYPDVSFIETENLFSFFDLNKKNIGQRLMFHYKDLLPNQELLKIARDFSPDWILTHNLTGLGWGSINQIKTKYPQIKWAHFLHDVQFFEPSGQIYYQENLTIFKNIWRKYWAKKRQQVFGNPDLIISPSQWLIDIHQKYHLFQNIKKIVLPNPIFNQDSQQNLNNQKGFIYVGRLSKDKGVEFLLSAIQSFSNIHLKIIGSGPLATKVKKIAQSNSNLVYLGSLSNTQVIQHMQQAQTLIMPSLIMENQPTVILEAVFSNLNVIATNVGGVQELIKGYGQIIEPNNILDLQKAIKNSLTQKPDQKIRQEILKKHQINHVMQEFLDYLLKA